MCRWNYYRAPPVLGLFAEAVDVLVRVLLLTDELLRSCVSLGTPDMMIAVRRKAKEAGPVWSS